MALPVLFMTGTYEEEQQKQGERLGVLGCVKKPFLPADIIKKVSEVLD